MSKSKESKSIDWWVKWIASIFLLAAMAFRATTTFPVVDLYLSTIGLLGWLWVGIIWKETALIVVNGVSVAILFVGIVNHLL